MKYRETYDLPQAFKSSEEYRDVYQTYYQHTREYINHKSSMSRFFYTPNRKTAYQKGVNKTGNYPIIHDLSSNRAATLYDAFAAIEAKSYDDAIKILKGINDDTIENMVAIYYHLGACYLHKKDYENAEAYLNQSFYIALEHKDVDLIDTLIALLRLYSNTNNTIGFDHMILMYQVLENKVDSFDRVTIEMINVIYRYNHSLDCKSNLKKIKDDLIRLKPDKETLAGIIIDFVHDINNIVDDHHKMVLAEAVFELEKEVMKSLR